MFHTHRGYSYIYRDALLAVFLIALAGTAVTAADTVDTPVHQFGLGDFMSFAVSPDGANLATTCADGWARIWDLETGALLLQLKTGPAKLMSYSPDGQRLLLLESGGGAAIWDIGWGLRLHLFPAVEGEMEGAVYSPDGQKVLTYTSFGRLTLWDALSGEELQSYQDEGRVRFAIFSPADGHVLVTLSPGGCKRWNTSSGTMEASPVPGFRKAVFSPDGGRIALSNGSANMTVVDAQSGATLATLPLKGSIIFMEFSADGTEIFASSGNQSSGQFFDAATGQLISKINDLVTPGAYIPPGDKVATYSYLSGISIREKTTGAVLRRITGFTPPVTSVDISPDASTILTGNDLGPWTIYGIASEAIQHEGGEYSTSAIFAPSGDRVLTSRGSISHLWSLQGAKLESYLAEEHNMRSPAFSPDGSVFVVCADTYQNLYVWDTEEGTVLRELQGASQGLNAAAISFDGAQALAGSSDKTAVLWDLDSGEKLQVFSGHTDYVISVAFSRDGKKVITGSQDNTARIWDKESGTTLQVLGEYSERVRDVAFAANDSIAVVGADSLYFLDSGTGQLLRRCILPSWVESVDVAPNGRSVAVGSWDGGAKIFGFGPMISLSGEPVVLLQCGSVYEDAGATAWDAEKAVDLSDQIVVHQDAIDSAVFGTYWITYDVANGSGVSAPQVRRKVIVTDSTPPHISLVGESSLIAECQQGFSDPSAAALDACDGDISEDIVLGGDIVDTGTPGVYVIQYAATDSHGNRGVAERAVLVEDTHAPEITVNGDNPLVTDCAGEIVDPGATSLDACGGVLVVESDAATAVNVMQPGNYTITYSSVDGSGLSQSALRVVTVLDNCAVEGLPEGIAEGTPEGIVEGVVEGAQEGGHEGSVEGVIEGAIEGQDEGQVVPEGALDGEIPDGEGIIDGESSGDGEGMGDGEGGIAIEGEGQSGGDGELEGEGVEDGEGVVEGAEPDEGEEEGNDEGEGESILPGGWQGCSGGEGKGASGLSQWPDWIAFLLGFVALLGMDSVFRLRRDRIFL